MEINFCRWQCKKPLILHSMKKFQQILMFFWWAKRYWWKVGHIFLCLLICYLFSFFNLFWFFFHVCFFSCLYCRLGNIKVHTRLETHSKMKRITSSILKEYLCSNLHFLYQISIGLLYRSMVLGEFLILQFQRLFLTLENF